MATIRQNFAVSSEDDHRDRMFPHYKAIPSYQPRSSGSNQDSRRIMCVLRDWTQANQRSGPQQKSPSSTPEIKVDRVGTQGLLIQENCPTSPRGERRMTPDLIRVSPQQQMAYQGGNISRGPASYLTTRPLSAEVPKHSSVENEIYQQSHSDDYKIQRTFESDQSSEASVQGLSFLNPTYSRLNSPTTSEGDFYSKENIRSISQMLLRTSPEAKSTPSQNNISEHWFEDRLGSGNNAASPSDCSSNENSSLYFKGSNLNPDNFSLQNPSNRSKQLSSHNSHTCLTNQVILSVSSKSSYSYSENASPLNLEQSSPKFVENSEVNDSLLSSPKFKALRIANSSDSAQSSPQIPRKSTLSPFKSSFGTDGESKNSLDSSTLSIATSWSSGLGIPFPQSHSSASLSTPSPIQKIHSNSLENFRRQGSANVEEDDSRNNDMFPWLVSKVAKPKEHPSESLQHISQSSGNIRTEIQNSVLSIHSRNRHGYQSGTLGRASYIYPPQYPSIPRAKTKEDTDNKLTDKSFRTPDHKTQLQQHSCCNCSCHEELAPSWKASGVKAPFPSLLYDQNQNIIELSDRNKGQNVGNLQTLHPVNRINNKDFWADSVVEKRKKRDAYNMKGASKSDKEEDSFSFKGHSTPVCTEPKWLTLSSTSVLQSSQGSEDNNNVLTSTDGLGFHFEGNQNNDLFPTIAYNKTLQNDQVSFSRKTFNEKEKVYSSDLFAAQKQRLQSELSDKSEHGICPTKHNMRISVENCGNLSHGISTCLNMNSPRSPPKSPNRIPPPLPKRDLSITISNKTKRSPLSLPPYTSDFSPRDITSQDRGCSHDQGWWERLDTDSYSPRGDGWTENQGENDDLFQKSQEESQSGGPRFQDRGYATDPLPRVGNKMDEEQSETKWGTQQAENLNASWGEVKVMKSKITGAESKLKQSWDSFRGRGSFEPLEGVTEYENVALIDVDEITRGSVSYKRNATEGPINKEQTTVGEEFSNLQFDKARSTIQGGNVKSIISKLESRGSKISQWGPSGFGNIKQDQRLIWSHCQYPEGTSLPMLPPSHPVPPQEHSFCNIPSNRTMKSSTQISTSCSKPVSNAEKGSVTSRSVPAALSHKSWNGIPANSDETYLQSTGGAGSVYSRDSVHPGRRYHQPDVIPTSAPTLQTEEDSTMYVLDEVKAHPGLYDRDRQRAANHQTRAPSLGVKGPMQQWVESSVLQLNLTESSSVQQWLFDIRMNTDCESMCILQGKSIHTSPVNLEMTANTIKENVLRLKTASKCLSAKFGQLHVKLAERSEGILESCSAICKEIYCVVKECEGFFLEIPSNLFSTLLEIQNWSMVLGILLCQQQSLVQETSQFKRLIEELESDVHGTLHPESHLTDQLLKLGEQCAVFVEIVQTKLIQALVYSVQDSASELNIMVSVKTVHSLITDYPSIKPILLQEQVISALFQVCLQTSFTVNSVQLLSLQTIAKFCQDTDGRIETEKIGGIGYLSQIISSPTSSESLRIEAAALISQLTAPEIVSDFRQSRFHQHLEVLLRALTDLMEQSRDPLVFLVASSAVANITFMGSIVFEFLAQDNAAKILVEGSKEGKVESLNIKDQVVTIFANMAEDQACRESIKQYEGIPLLIELLQTQVAGFETEDNKQASDEVVHDAKLCEQIQQKSAIALARLSKDKTCAAEIKQLEGISIFSRICRTSSYRNKSVPVLIACLAALRRLHHALGPSSFHQDDIDILVRPKMIESIFSCSSMSEESFV